MRLLRTWTTSTTTLGEIVHLPLGNFIQMIEERCDTLAESPSLGRSRPELGRNIRSFPAGNYTIFYLALEDGVEVIRVIHGARDITTMF